MSFHSPLTVFLAQKDRSSEELKKIFVVDQDGQDMEKHVVWIYFFYCGEKFERQELFQHWYVEKIGIKSRY